MGFSLSHRRSFRAMAEVSPEFGTQSKQHIQAELSRAELCRCAPRMIIALQRPFRSRPSRVYTLRLPEHCSQRFPLVFSRIPVAVLVVKHSMVYLLREGESLGICGTGAFSCGDSAFASEQYSVNPHRSSGTVLKQQHTRISGRPEVGRIPHGERWPVAYAHWGHELVHLGWMASASSLIRGDRPPPIT